MDVGLSRTICTGAVGANVARFLVSWVEKMACATARPIVPPRNWEVVSDLWRREEGTDLAEGRHAGRLAEMLGVVFEFGSAVLSVSSVREVRNRKSRTASRRDCEGQAKSVELHPPPDRMQTYLFCIVLPIPIPHKIWNPIIAELFVNSVTV